MAARPLRRSAGTRPAGSRTRLFLATLAAGLLFFLFLLLGFPYELLAGRATARLEEALGARIDFASVGPGLGLAGPRLRGRDVRVVLPGGEPLRFERVTLRPAWSLSWLRLKPALRIGLAGPPGRIDATAWPGAEAAWAGGVRDFDLTGLPIEAWRPGFDLSGLLAGEFDLAAAGAVYVGRVRFEASEGVLELPVLPLAVPFTTVTGELLLEENGRVDVTAFDLAGPLLGLTLEGGIGPGRPLEQAPLQLQGSLRAADPGIRQAFASARLRFGPDGVAPIRVAGTLAAPTLR